MDINIALWKLNPNYYYSCPHGLYSNLVMLDNSLKPSLLELHEAWLSWLNNEYKLETIVKLELLAEKERLKYITPGYGKNLAYSQKQKEVEKWQSGNSNKNNFPMSTQEADKLNVSYTDILQIWQSNINNWLAIGSRIEANLAKIKANIMAMNVVNQSDLDNLLVGINWLE